MVLQCSRVLLPGLSTHLALQCDLTLSTAQLRARYPCHRRYNCQRATEEQLRAAGGIVGLFMWWAHVCHLSPDDTLTFCRDSLRDVLPRAKEIGVVHPDTAAACAYSLHVDNPEAADGVRRWWSRLADEALTTMLRVQLRRLPGTAITRETSVGLRLRPSRSGLVSRISADGVHFPETRGALRDEALKQAREQYCGRAGLAMDVPRLRAGAAMGFCPSCDDLDDASTMTSLLGGAREWGASALSLSDPPSVRELRALLRKRSDATALDELPRSVLRHLPGHALAALGSLFTTQSSGTRSSLDTALHLPLVKREPSWQLKNSRPVILAPYIRRLEASCWLRRLHDFLEGRHMIPSTMGPYRRQMSPQQIALLGRWLITHWTASGYVVRVIDWDESNAFCNVPRDDVGAVTGDWCHGAADWLRSFYDSLQVRVVTPHGLTDPYPLRHGGAQGDPGGVGCYEIVGILRTNFQLGVAAAGLDPRDLSPGAPVLSSYCLRLPHPPRAPLLDLHYSDDRRMFAHTDVGIAHVLSIACHVCWAAGGSVNPSKLKAYKVRRLGDRLCHPGGVLRTVLEPIPYSTHGLHLTGIPLVMGSPPRDAITRAAERLRHLLHAVRRLRPM